MNDILNLQNESNILPISLATIKNYVRVDFANDDELLTKLLKTAIKNCESYIGKTIIEKTYILSVYEDRCKVKLPYPPVKNINEVNMEYIYDDVANILSVNTGFNRLDVNYTAGMNTIDDELVQGILMHVARMYEDKSGYSTMPQNSIFIYQKYKQIRL
ncbi:MAG: head-tail connector protein [Rickettsiales bacterium]|jgi:hypothetical protein|nr:head-tail connector protein [Rickettsiales bacterium]